MTPAWRMSHMKKVPRIETANCARPSHPPDTTRAAVAACPELLLASDPYALSSEVGAKGNTIV